jgi:hypothetical protein
MRCHLGEPKAGIDHQRRADDEHGVCLFEGCLRGGHLIAWNALAEENHIWLLDAPTRSAGRNSELGKVQVIEVGIAIGQRRGVQADPVRI